MLSRHYLLVCATLLCCGVAVVLTQDANGRFPRTKFACRGRPSGYYADVETGCQVYHMCDELGRQFSYSCPNTTLFQQRMLVCDHWYMVDCQKSEKDYDANLLIGQRDKPFVSEAEMRLRTPRPDILGVPPNSNYYDGLKEAESKYPVHPGNSIVGVADSISNSNNNGLDSGKNQYRPPTSWSSGTQNQRPTTNGQFNQLPTANTPISRPQSTNQPIPSPGLDLSPPFIPSTTTRSPQASEEYELDIRMDMSKEEKDFTPQGRENRRLTTKYNNQRPTANTPTNRFETQDNLAGAASQRPTPTYDTVPDNTGFTSNIQNTELLTNQHIPSPSLDLSPPFAPSTTETPLSADNQKKIQDPVFNFIKRFDPNSPDSHKTAMTTSEILDINQQLPEGHDVSGEDERTPRRNKNHGNNLNTLQPAKNKDFTEHTKFNSVNAKNNNFVPNVESTQQNHGIPEPDRNLLPPKREFSTIITTTEGPPVYYQWKWAVPAFDLEPPKFSNDTRNSTEVLQGRNVPKGEGGPTFEWSKWSTTTTEEPALRPVNTEYNISSYFVPDYQFPLDKPHPGYENENAETSFKVKVERPGRASFGENPACPHCHPAYLKPGTCEPCIVQR